MNLVQRCCAAGPTTPNYAALLVADNVLVMK